VRGVGEELAQRVPKGPSGRLEIRKLGGRPDWIEKSQQLYSDNQEAELLVLLKMLLDQATTREETRNSMVMIFPNRCQSHCNQIREQHSDRKHQKASLRPDDPHRIHYGMVNQVESKRVVGEEADCFAYSVTRQQMTRLCRGDNADHGGEQQRVTRETVFSLISKNWHMTQSTQVDCTIEWSNRRQST
jgi:hypothetical protein